MVRYHSSIMAFLETSSTCLPPRARFSPWVVGLFSRSFRRSTESCVQRTNNC